MNALGILSSFLTTMSATLFIGLKIFLVTRQSHMRRTYARIVIILVESAALVSVIGLLTTILIFQGYVHPSKLYTTSGGEIFQLAYYLGALVNPVMVITPVAWLIIQSTDIDIQGIGPTLIAIRVANEPSKATSDPPSGNHALSHLTFRRSSRSTDAANEITRTTVSRVSFLAHSEQPPIGVHAYLVKGQQDNSPNEHEQETRKELTESV